MKRVIRFSRLRFVMIGISASLIITGVVVFALRGFNLGIDFRGGVSLQIQIAPVAMTLDASGQDKIEASSHTGQANLAGGEAIDLAVTTAGETKAFSFPLSQYSTVGELAAAFRTVPGVRATLSADASVATSRLFPIEAPVDISKKPLVLNYPLAPGDTVYASIEKVRATLAELGQPEVQTLGRPADQQFVVKLGVPADDNGEFRATIGQRITGLLGTAFPPEQVLLRKTDYVGPKLAGELVTQTISVVAVSLVLMLIYLSFRFRFEFALACVICIIQDTAVMTTFVLLSGMEFSTSIIAAILTIIGYSVNDTIVIFDRVRENSALMRDLDDKALLDTTVTQTLSRTIITSLTTLIATVALFIFTTGSLRDFSLVLIVGIIEGTWSTIYIASPIVMAWHTVARRIVKRREEKKYGDSTAKGDQAPRRPAIEERAIAAAAAAADAGETVEGEGGGAAAPAPASLDRGTVVRQQQSRKKRRKR